MHAATLLTALAGGLLGVRHAFEPDHLAAVATLTDGGATQTRQFSGVALAKNALLGAWWGVGHTAALVTVIAGFSMINATMAPAIEKCFELIVAAMLMLLGVRAIVRSYRSAARGPLALHRHAQAAHSHAGGAHIHFGGSHIRTLHWRPLAVGAIHGLAGSGALLILVATHIDTVAGRLLYALMFGLGSVLGMAAMTAASGMVLHRLTSTTQHWLHRGLGACSIGMGVWWAALTLTY
jgi:High-affinity nickel-transport protein